MEVRRSQLVSHLQIEIKIEERRTVQPYVVVTGFPVGNHNGTPGRNKDSAGVWARVPCSSMRVDAWRNEFYELQFLRICSCLDIPGRPLHHRKRCNVLQQ